MALITLVTPRASVRPVIDRRAQSARAPGGTKIVTTTNTKLVCGTIVLLACIAAVLYLSTTNNNDLTAFGLIGTIICSVLVGTFGLAKLDRIEQRVERVQRQTNGELHSVVEQIIEQRLSATGQHPLHGQALADRDD